MNNQTYFTAAAPFEAARQLDPFSLDHRERRLHGHSFLVQVWAESPSENSLFSDAEVNALAEQLQAAIAPLDYAFLNDHLPMPTDENLVHWIRARLDRAEIKRISVQSTRNQGVSWSRGGSVHLWRRFHFEAAHQLPHVPPGHPCGRMHGHGFAVILHALLPNRSFLDYERLEAQWAPLHEQLHLNCLNELPGLENPTSERLANWLWQRMKPQLPALSWVTVYETATAGCHYDGRHYRIWKERYFESALCLSNAPQGDPRQRIHGHSYVLRLHLTAPLDAVLGWTVDYGEVKARFEPLYQQLDHHRLDELDGLAKPTLAGLLSWMHKRMSAALPALDQIDLEQTPGCGATLCWGNERPLLPG